MTIEFFWRLPTQGDGAQIPGDNRRRGDWNLSPAESTGALSEEARDDDLRYIDYLSQVTRAAEINGFKGTLMVAGPACDEPWIISSLLAREARHFKFVVAFQPFHIQPSYAALMATTFQRATGNRLMWNIINGGFEAIQHGYGDHVEHDARYERAEEFIEVVKGLWSNEAFSYAGKYYQIESGGLKGPHARPPLPPICTTGSSPVAKRLAARHAEIYLMRAESPANVRDIIEEMTALAAAEGRTMRFGMSVDTLARETEAEAFGEARRFLDDGLAAGAAEAARRAIERSSSHGSRRQWQQHAERQDRFEDLFVAPNVWTGFGRIGIPPGTALVGSYRDVAERIREFHDAGVELFILSGYPHLEECYRIGEGVMPLLRDLRRKTDAAAAQRLRVA